MKRLQLLFLLALTIFSLSAAAQQQRIITLAGIGSWGYSGDGFAATGAQLDGPVVVALDRPGNVYVIDYYNIRVREIKLNGTIVTFAGIGVIGCTGDNSAATSARIYPHGLATDRRGNCFIADAECNIIRRVNNIGIISTYAGSGTLGYYGDSVNALAGRFDQPQGLCVDSRGTLIVADAGNHIVRSIDTNGLLRTVAGDDTAGYSGDNFPARNARIDSPIAVAIDKYGSIFIVDYKSNVIRKVDKFGIITTFAGTGVIGYTGDNALAVNATFNRPRGVAVDTVGRLYIADSYNNVIRMVDTNGIIKTVVGNSWPGYGGDLGNPLGANLFHPTSVVVDTFGSIYIADAENQRVRKVYYPTVGVYDVHTEGSYAVMPNPAEGFFKLTGASVNDKVSVTDMMGRTVAGAWTVTSAGEQSFDVSELNAGVYLINIASQEGNKLASIKMVKQ